MSKWAAVEGVASKYVDDYDRATVPKKKLPSSGQLMLFIDFSVLV